MASVALSTSLLKAKFRGCMLGTLIGDCFGGSFEFEGYRINTEFKIRLPSKERLCDFMTDMMKEESVKLLIYTDDTTMTKNVASSLAEKGKVDAKDMAEKFVADYYNPKIDRGYGPHVRRVFYKLRESEFADIFLPAKEQFNGEGSFGNGAPMRIAPIALFGINKGEEFIMNAAKECSLITHAHPNGYRGAILQCLAVSAVLGLDPSQEFDPVGFINSLLNKMKEIETEEVKPYCESLEKMLEIFRQNRDNIVSSEEIANTLGNGHDVSALKSVPTAIFSFLRGMKPLQISDESAPTGMSFDLKSIPGAIYSYLTGKKKEEKNSKNFETSNPFLRTIYFAISVGGDTDTIGAMAGAIAGAYYGEDMIPDVVQKKCEAYGDVISLADKLFDATFENK